MWLELKRASVRGVRASELESESEITMRISMASDGRFSKRRDGICKAGIGDLVVLTKIGARMARRVAKTGSRGSKLGSSMESMSRLG